MRQKVLVFLIVIFGSFNLVSQDFDDSGVNFFQIGFEKGGLNYVTGGMEYSVSKLLYLGVGADYALSGPSGEFGFADRLIFEFKGGVKLRGFKEVGDYNVLLGFHGDFAGTKGLHAQYQYFMSEEFGLFGRANYFFDRRDQLDGSAFGDQDHLSFELGIKLNIFGSWGGVNW